MKKFILMLGLNLSLLTSILIANDLPELAFKQYAVSDESSEVVHELVAEGAKLVFPSPKKARALLLYALTKVSNGAKIDTYDYLWTQYGLMKSSMESGGNTFGPGTLADYLHLARNVLKFLESTGSTGEWLFTELGAFKMEVCREAANGLGWNMMEEGKKLEEALDYVNEAVSCMRGEEDNYIYDTKVRILLKMNKRNEAYKIVKSILNEDPHFGDFQDIKNDANYKKWLRKSK